MSEEKTNENAKWKIKYRVLAGPREMPRILFSTKSYESAEKWLWNFDGNEIELRIEKVWIQK
jgi:hypothetical protein